jgi:hypothetical protein
MRWEFGWERGCFGIYTSDGRITLYKLWVLGQKSSASVMRKDWGYILLARATAMLLASHTRQNYRRESSI